MVFGSVWNLFIFLQSTTFQKRSFNILFLMKYIVIDNKFANPQSMWEGLNWAVPCTSFADDVGYSTKTFFFIYINSYWPCTCYLSVHTNLMQTYTKPTSSQANVPVYSKKERKTPKEIEQKRGIKGKKMFKLTWGI